MNDWVSMRVERPPLHEEVLLHYLDGTILIGCRFRFGFLHEKAFGVVTHWMRLPSPPTK